MLAELDTTQNELINCREQLSLMEVELALKNNEAKQYEKEVARGKELIAEANAKAEQDLGYKEGFEEAVSCN